MPERKKAMRIIGGILLILAVTIRDGVNLLISWISVIENRAFDQYFSNPATYVRLAVPVLCLLTAVFIASGKLKTAGILQVIALTLQSFLFFYYTVGIGYGTVRLNFSTLLGVSLLTAMLLYALGLLIRGKAGMILLIAAGAAMASYLFFNLMDLLLFGGGRTQIIKAAAVAVTAGPLYFMGMLFTGIYQGSQK